MHEIEFLHRFEAAGHRVRWIPRDTEKFSSTNDFTWSTGKGLVCELKCTTTKYKTIKQDIQGAVLRARAHGVTKDVFVVDIGRHRLSQKLRTQLSRYNARVQHGKIGRLFVMSGDGDTFEEITLLEP